MAYEVESFFLNIQFSDVKKECRRNKKFFNALFELLFADEGRAHHIELELAEKNLLDVKKSVFGMIDEYRLGENDYNNSSKQAIFRYLTSRGVEFEINSEGTDILISTCAAMKDSFHLFPHEVYHHFQEQSTERAQ